MNLSLFSFQGRLRRCNGAVERKQWPQLATADAKTLEKRYLLKSYSSVLKGVKVLKVPLGQEDHNAGSTASTSSKLKQRDKILPLKMSKWPLKASGKSPMKHFQLPQGSCDSRKLHKMHACHHCMHTACQKSFRKGNHCSN